MAGAQLAPEAVASFPTIRKIDTGLYRIEQVLCGVCFLAMAIIMFADVVRGIFGTRHEPWHAVLLFGLCWAALRTRVVREGEVKQGHARSLVWSLALTVAIGGAVELYTRLLPGGFIWAPKMALCLMLWVSFFGASMATYEKAHLALEFGEKLWPQRLLRFVKAAAYAVTSAFTFVLLYLSIHSVANHYERWAVAGGDGDVVPSMEWMPQWAVLLIFPYLFGIMTIRILAQAYTTATGTAVEPEEQLPT